MTVNRTFKHCNTFILTPKVIQTISSSTVACEKLKTVTHFPNKKPFNKLVKTTSKKRKLLTRKIYEVHLLDPPAPAFYVDSKKLFSNILIIQIMVSDSEINFQKAPPPPTPI